MLGESAHATTESEMPSHYHRAKEDNSGKECSILCDPGVISTDFGLKFAENQQAYTAKSTYGTARVGSGLPHNNMQPSLHLNQIIKI